jgi:hypothetical protein
MTDNEWRFLKGAIKALHRECVPLLESDETWNDVFRHLLHTDIGPIKPPTLCSLEEFIDETNTSD